MTEPMSTSELYLIVIPAMIGAAILAVACLVWLFRAGLSVKKRHRLEVGLPQSKVRMVGNLQAKVTRAHEEKVFSSERPERDDQWWAQYGGPCHSLHCTTGAGPDGWCYRHRPDASSFK